jgi:hypothetical protein
MSARQAIADEVRPRACKPAKSGPISRSRRRFIADNSRQLRRRVFPVFHRVRQIAFGVGDTATFNDRLRCFAKRPLDNPARLKPMVNHVMQRYFFDFVGRSRSEFDYSGRELPSAEKALRLAELIALDESSRGERIGWKINVHDAAGNQYFSVQVDALPELAAA